MEEPARRPYRRSRVAAFPLAARSRRSVSPSLARVACGTSSKRLPSGVIACLTPASSEVFRDVLIRRSTNTLLPVQKCLKG
eukprot:1546231-Amphidinium_carterae.5